MIRDDLITYLNTQSLGTINVSNELPWTKDGVPLYLNNFKYIYVDRPTLEQEGAINTLDGDCIVNQTTTMTAYLVVDAKNQPTNFSTVLSTMQTARNQVNVSAKTSRTCSVSQEYEGDALITEFEYRFIETLT